MTRGFGKRYFTLASILAHSVAPRLHARHVSCTQRSRIRDGKETAKNEADEAPPSLLESFYALPLTDAKPCHCNCFFKRMARLMFMLYRYIPRCPYYTTFYAFRRTGVHPPAS